MSLRINSNTAAFNAYRNLTINDGMLSKSLEKLSSGFRVNRAADDAAGLIKSESLRADIRGLGQAVKNAQDGISFVQTAEGALVEVHSILQRMNELAVSAANTATSDGSAEQAEVDQLLTQIGEIGSQTPLLDRNPNPTETEIRYALAGNLCRCTGYDKIVRAVQATAKDLRKSKKR